jgi:hypothetical protein
MRRRWPSFLATSMYRMVPSLRCARSVRVPMPSRSAASCKVSRSLGARCLRGMVGRATATVGELAGSSAASAGSTTVTPCNHAAVNCWSTVVLAGRAAFSPPWGTSGVS